MAHSVNNPNFPEVRYDNPIGHGSYGEVYAATFTSGEYYGTKCAIKQVTHIQSARQEAKILEKLKHENIVGYFGYKEQLQFGRILTAYIYMEFCNGGTLMELLKTKKKRSDIVHFEWMKQMSSGLEHLESKKIVHRDLKPDNILVNINTKGECQLKISDFGLAKQMKEMSFSDGQKLPIALKTKVFPFLYAAPEVYNGDQYDTRADVFSLGNIFYGMLEDCFKDCGESRHYGAFVYIPHEGERIPLGIAQAKYSEAIKIGITENISPLSNHLKYLTLGMMRADCSRRMTATEVKQALNRIENEADPAVAV